MQYMTQSIRRLLGFSFAAVLVLLLLVVAVAEFQQTKISRITQHLNSELANRERDALEWTGILGSQGFIASELIATGDPDKQKPLRAQLAANLKKVQDWAGIYVATAETSDDDKALLAQIAEAHTAYVAANAAILQAVDSGSHDYSQSEFNDKLVPGITRYQKVLDAWARRQQALMMEGVDALETAQSKARFGMITLGLLACSLGAVLAWRISFNLGRAAREATRVASAVADGVLDVQVRPQRTFGEMTELLRVLQSMQSTLSQMVARVRSGSDGVATASGEIAQGNHDLSARTESQASALEETAATMEQLSAQVRQNADNARQASQLAHQASEVAARGGDVVDRVVTTMKEINGSSKKIADIISVIDGIAFQTNILALNAAVEAARAGEQGRGFAVVASEVRSLAGRSANAAKEIKSLITDSVGRVEQGSLLVDQAGSTMNDVVAAIRKVSELVGEISSATQEQASGVAQVGEAITQMDHVTQQNAALVEQMAAATSSLKAQAGDLVATVAVFKSSAESIQLTL